MTSGSTSGLLIIEGGSGGQPTTAIRQAPRHRGIAHVTVAAQN